MQIISEHTYAGRAAVRPALFYMRRVVGVKSRHKMRKTMKLYELDERIPSLVDYCGLTRIDLVSDDLAALRDASPGQYGRD